MRRGEGDGDEHEVEGDIVKLDREVAETEEQEERPGRSAMKEAKHAIMA